MADAFGSDRRPIELRHERLASIQARRDIQLRDGFFPLPQNRIKLKKDHAECRILWFVSSLFLRMTEEARAP